MRHINVRRMHIILSVDLGNCSFDALSIWTPVLYRFCRARQDDQSAEEPL